MSPERLMRRAIALSKRGFPAPNPHVGCVIAQHGEVVGEGWHAFAGGPHAEIVALERAGERARRADLYVTLEPCDHQGRTPPCTDALIRAGVRSVVAAVLDPNPQAKGGLQRLRSAGIDVSSGLCEEEARAANEMWLTAMERRRPYVVGKAAMSLDGRVALPSGESKWITSEKARRQGHRLRAECGAVLVGRGTVEADDPHLTARFQGVRNQPTRLVLDPRGSLTGKERVFGPEAPTWHLVADAAGEGQVEVPADGGDVDLEAMLHRLFERGLTSILIEGGPRTLSGFLRRGLVDRLELFLAPKLLGAGPAWFQADFGGLDGALGLVIERSKLIGPDLWITGRPWKR